MSDHGAGGAAAPITPAGGGSLGNVTFQVSRGRAAGAGSLRRPPTAERRDGVLVRDRTEPKGEYKGRPTDARDGLCPCRPCFNAHDCGRRNTVGEWRQDMQCATRYNNGCPTAGTEPEHVYSGPRARVCRRCGARRVK